MIKFNIIHLQQNLNANFVSFRRKPSAVVRFNVAAFNEPDQMLMNFRLEGIKHENQQQQSCRGCKNNDRKSFTKKKS